SAASESAAGGATRVAAVAPSGAPQPPQNFSPVSFRNPQRAHGTGSSAPHSAQKRRPARLSAPQREQEVPVIVAKRSSAGSDGGRASWWVHASPKGHGGACSP